MPESLIERVKRHETMTPFLIETEPFQALEYLSLAQVISQVTYLRGHEQQRCIDLFRDLQRFYRFFGRPTP